MKDPQNKETYGEEFSRECDEERSNVGEYNMDDGLDGAGASGYGGAFD